VDIAASHIAATIRSLRRDIGEGVQLVAVSKFHPVEALQAAYDAGQRLFGESRQQELLQKIPLMPSDVKWHFIGHLQTNKVKSIVGRVSMIESVDSVRLLGVIQREAAQAGVVQNVLLQVHVAAEETKFGFDPDELISYLVSGHYKDMPNVRLCGVMGMASNTDDSGRVSADFRRIARTFRRAAEIVADPAFRYISMGMTHDYPLAIAEGANLIRVGTMIFGEREY